MAETDREILTEIRVNTAVTREKVEGLSEDVEALKETTESHDGRIASVESEQKKTNQRLATVGGVASFIGACITAVSAKLLQWF